MKKLSLIFALMLSCGYAMAQKTVETIHLKNGGLVKGEIIEQVPGHSLKVKTKDGNIFVYQMDEVERITRDDTTTSDGHGHKGLDFTVNTGYDIATKGGGGSINAELELGKRFSKSFYWGLGSGANFATSSGGSITVPITTNVKTFFPIEGSSVAPYAMLKAGYLVNTDNTDFSGILLSIMPGIQFPLTKTIDMNLGAGYTHVIYQKGSGGAISIRMGFNLHNASNRVHVKKELPPSKSDVMQLTIEANSNLNPQAIDGPDEGSFAQLGLNAILSYKLTQKLMVGVGAGYGFYNSEEPSWEDRDDDKEYVSIDGPAVKGFIRGVYRFSDHRFSPFFSCDMGMRFCSIDHGGDVLKDQNKSQSFTNLYVTPALGLSLRTSRNSYLDLTAGYDIAGKKSWKTEKSKYESGAMSAMFIRLGFTRTLTK